MSTVAEWQRYVAVGDSITEGLCDPVIGEREPWFGWADRLAVILDGDARLAERRFAYANLAVRGRRVRDVVEQQIPTALALRADLVSVLVGANDLMIPKADPDAVAAELETGIARLREAGSDVLLATSFDPRFAPFLKPFRGRAAVFNANLWSIARQHGTYILDLWGAHELQAKSMWADDRVHLTPAGHRVLARRASHALGVPYFEVSPGGAERIRTDENAHAVPGIAWLHRHALPWFGRRLRGATAGDGMSAKLPHLIRLDPHLDPGAETTDEHPAREASPGGTA